VPAPAGRPSARSCWRQASWTTHCSSGWLSARARSSRTYRHGFGVPLGWLASFPLLRPVASLCGCARAYMPRLLMPTINELRMRGLIFLLADSQSRAAACHNRHAAGSPRGCARRPRMQPGGAACRRRQGLSTDGSRSCARLWGRSGPTTAAGTWADGRRGSAAV
jgi:hypothetical protein